MSTGELADRPPLNDDDRAGLPQQQPATALGGQFGLGLPQGRTRYRQLPAYGEWGQAIGLLVAVFGLPIGLPFVFSPQFAATARLATGVALAGVLVVSWTLYGVGFARSVITRQLFRYPGGLVMVLDGEPEPRVARWADVSTVTVYLSDADDEGLGALTGCDVAAADVELPGQKLNWRGSELRELVDEASRELSPRLGAALAEEYQNGGAARFGQLRVDAAGIMLADAERVPWEVLESVTLERIAVSDGGHVNRIMLRRTDRPAVAVRLSGLPNGIFLPPVLTRAAADRGIPVSGDRP